MSASEIIEQIQELPPDQQVVIARFFAGLVKRQEPSGVLSREERLQKAADKVFTEHAELLRRLAQ